MMGGPKGFVLGWCVEGLVMVLVVALAVGCDGLEGECFNNCSNDGTCVFYDDGSSFCSCRSGKYGPDCSLSDTSCTPTSLALDNEDIVFIVQGDLVYLNVSMSLVANLIGIEVVLGPFPITKTNPLCRYPGYYWSKSINNCTEIYESVMSLEMVSKQCAFAVTESAVDVSLSINYLQESPKTLLHFLTSRQFSLHYSIYDPTQDNNSSNSSGIDSALVLSDNVAGTVVLTILGICFIVSCLYNAGFLDSIFENLKNDVEVGREWLVEGKAKVNGKVLSKRIKKRQVVIVYEITERDENPDESLGSEEMRNLEREKETFADSSSK
eukprot:TRINITY_DN79_c0_g1_i1.p1 TRINITY_DN79_c0_g1~~TRINITY_DN79_c0_g1_i1.p1  ORF type:complete len:324 (-),score=51.88 TRINITY_DN79_c0_g1_i1:557-1528(-)